MINHEINIPASVPAASSLGPHRSIPRRDVNNSNSRGSSATNLDDFDADNLFEVIETQPRETILDSDLDRLLGPLPINNNRRVLEQETNGQVTRGPGNMIVVCPNCLHRGFGIMGPHWFGPVCCLGLMFLATIYFAPKAYANINPVSSVICILFFTVGAISLAVVSCSDPGIVKREACIPSEVSAARGWRYCDLCSLYQPPGAVHCPDCNVCIEGYDHHCPWMGTCIGKKNFTPFMVFNLTWLLYLMYALGWVVFLGHIKSGMTHHSDGQ